MTYSEIIPLAMKGKLIKLPNFEGIFKWDYAKENLVFNNGSFWRDTDDLDILWRTDFYYII